MKRQINLYGAEFRPRRQWASLNQMALVWGGSVLLLLCAAGVIAWQQHAVERELVQVRAALEIKRGEAQRLDAELARHQADGLLQQQLATKQEELTAKQGLMRQLGSLALQKSQGYAGLMADLSVSGIRSSPCSESRSPTATSTCPASPGAARMCRPGSTVSSRPRRWRASSLVS